MEKETPQQEIPSSFDDFMKSLPLEGEEKESDKDKIGLVEKFAEERLEWKNKIDDMSQRMKKVFELNELMTIVYSERQRAVEYYYYLLSLLIKINKVYKLNYSKKYDYYSFSSQKRFPNERTKELTIEVELSDILEKRQMIDNHAKFMDRTIGTVDNIIYGIKYRIEIEQISRGK